MNLIVYATTSGATQDVATMLAAMIGEADTRLVNLRKDPLTIDGDHDWVFAGTPTYGKGDWHYAWIRRHLEVGPALKRASRVALFGLGDSVHHAETFAGGIGHLSRFCRDLGVVTLGQVPEHRRSPSVVDGYFPGLVIEYGRERRRVQAMLTKWLRGLGVGNLAMSSTSPTVGGFAEEAGDKEAMAELGELSGGGE